jgi:hypothetical protein
MGDDGLLYAPLSSLSLQALRLSTSIACLHKTHPNGEWDSERKTGNNRKQNYSRRVRRERRGPREGYCQVQEPILDSRGELALSLDANTGRREWSERDQVFSRKHGRVRTASRLIDLLGIRAYV